MPSRGPKCLKIYYSRLEDRALTKELVDFFGSSPLAKNLLKSVVNQVIPAVTLLHALRRQRPFQISPQRAVELVLDLQIPKKKVCRAPQHAISKLQPKLHFTERCIPVENLELASKLHYNLVNFVGVPLPPNVADCNFVATLFQLY